MKCLFYITLCLGLLFFACSDSDSKGDSTPDIIRYSAEVGGNTYVYSLDYAEEEYYLTKNGDEIESGIFESTDEGYRFIPADKAPYEGMSDENLYIPADVFPWEDEDFDAIALYTLEISAEHGEVDVSPLMAAYPTGTEITLTPQASAGYVFSRWSGDASGNDTPLTITIEENMEITVRFQRDEGSHDVHGAWNLVHEEEVWMEIENGDTLDSEEWPESIDDTTRIWVFNTNANLFEVHDYWDGNYWYDEGEFFIEGNSLLGEGFDREWEYNSWREEWHTEYSLQGNTLVITHTWVLEEFDYDYKEFEIHTLTFERYEGSIPPDHWDIYEYEDRYTPAQKEPSKQIFERLRNHRR
ncbi:InlB B-repeat-containing protein [Chitinivibrio alkaliphilus]|uniref:Bacterial repeat domain-containing protein n=1 Tax=Chitinivibrio alkaliphilus ACht1 TaxID=1313304 RepID=U7D590_9BACT|nr:hypothetical protein [Chitinivibrio alkaliphilus]ERP30731.1 hypothetical protein CALK_2448 [Chitinivibrio alkaliphilus ACht1]